MLISNGLPIYEDDLKNILFEQSKVLLFLIYMFRIISRKPFAKLSMIKRSKITSRVKKENKNLTINYQVSVILRNHKKAIKHRVITRVNLNCSQNKRKFTKSFSRI